MSRTLLAVPVVFLSLAAPASAGNGKVRVDGTTKLVDCCVSIRFSATPAQIESIKTAFRNANAVLADATDGQFRFGKIGLVNNSGADLQSEVWINSGPGRAVATYGEFGVPGAHINLYFDDNFMATSGANGDAYTIAHEFAHHLWGLGDEYQGNAGAAECEPTPGSATANFSLMDNYFTRGGNSAGGGYTLNEFCIAANHDPDADTVQSAIHGGDSCWETISLHPTRSATAPAGLPESAAPAVTDPDFREPGTERRFVLCIDRSGSMAASDGGAGTPTRLDYAKQAAGIFVQLTRVQDALGVVSFSDNVSTNFPLTTITGPAETNAAIAAVNSLAAGGSTAIGSGLIRSRDLIVNAPTMSCAQTILLLTDGFGNAGPSELTVIPSLVANDISVIAIAIGTSVSTANLQAIAQQTGGRFFQVATAADLPALLSSLTAESSGAGVLAQAPGDVGAGDEDQVATAVEADTTELRFVLSWTTPLDDLDLEVLSPDGSVYGGTPVAGGAEVIESPGLEILTVRGAAVVPGTWTTTVRGDSVQTTAEYQLSVLSDFGTTRLIAASEKLAYVYPEVVSICATPQWRGQNVVGALVTGVLHKPNGTTSLLSFRDDGAPGSTDPVSQDGSYKARIASFGGPGTYVIELLARATESNTYAGESLFISAGAPSNAVPVPEFQRATTYSVFIENAPTLAQFPCFEVRSLLTNVLGSVFASCSLDVDGNWQVSEPLDIVLTDSDSGRSRVYHVPGGAFTPVNAAAGSYRYDSPPGAPDFHAFYSFVSRRLTFHSLGGTTLPVLDGPALTVRLETTAAFGETTIPLAPMFPGVPVQFSYFDPNGVGCATGPTTATPR